MISQHETIMHFIGEVGDDVFFSQRIDDEGMGQPEQMRMSGEMWRHYGRPQVITVSVRPGDHLNPPDHEAYATPPALEERPRLDIGHLEVTHPPSPAEPSDSWGPRRGF